MGHRDPHLPCSEIQTPNSSPVSLAGKNPEPLQTPSQVRGWRCTGVADGENGECWGLEQSHWPVDVSVHRRWMEWGARPEQGE